MNNVEILTFYEQLAYLDKKKEDIQRKFLDTTIRSEHLTQVVMLSYFDKYEIQNPLDFYDKYISKEEIDSAIDKYDFRQIKNEILLDLTWPKELFHIESKVAVKVKGKKFIVHKNDVDPFPSSPHAHCYENNYKIDLSNGKCYLNKKHLDTLPKKVFWELRNKLESLGILLPAVTRNKEKADFCRPD